MKRACLLVAGYILWVSKRVPYIPYRILCTVYHTPLGRFSVVDISTVGIVPVPQRSALETRVRELSQDVSFGIDTLLDIERTSLENLPEGV